MGTNLLANIPDVVGQIMAFQAADIVIALLIFVAVLMVVGFILRIPINALRGQPIFTPVFLKKGT